MRLPTADADKRAVELDQFPSAMIESIQVSKTFTPDQQGDTSGGAVNVILKGIPDETVFEIGAGTTFNTQVTGNDDFMTYKGGGVNVLGIDDGRDIPDDENMLPFIAICAAAAPLLGLLGTVTGIINTFKLITVFGTGDVKTLSGGISEALITAKFGLIVAVPSLLLHAFLSRKARSAIDQMEKAAIAFANQVSKAHHERLNHSATNDGLRNSPKAESPDADIVQVPTAKPSNGAGDPP